MIAVTEAMDKSFDFSSVPLPVLAFALACLPMITVHYLSLYHAAMTTRVRNFMWRSLPVAVAGAAAAMLKLEHGEFYAGAMLGPYIQWHVARVMFDRHVSEMGRPPRTFGRRMLEGDTNEERIFSLACGMAVVVLPIGIVGIVSWLLH
jgi:hypothetical protein